MDTQPTPVIMREVIPLMSHVKREMAAFVGCEGRDLFLVENCTTGTSTILNSLEFTSEDTIFTLNLHYGK